MYLNNFHSTKKKILTDYIPMVITFISIISLSIIYKQSFIKVLPVSISLLVMLIHAYANRIGFLIGAANSLIYIFGYFLEGLYGSVMSAAFGAIMQFVAFFKWKEHAYKNSTIFKKMRAGKTVLLYILFIIIWITTMFVLKKINGTEAFFDSLIMVSGFVLPIMDMMAIIDELPLLIINQSCSVIMWIRIVLNNNLANLTYLIYSIYAFYMVIRKTIKWITLYKEQHNIKKNNSEDGNIS